jgi:heptosyltransferase-2
VPWFAGIPVRTGWRGEMRYGLLNDLRLLDEAALPLIVERYAALAQPAGEALERPVPAPRLAVDPVSRHATLARFGLGTTSPVVALAPGAEYGPAKRWPARHFATVARHYARQGYQCWVFGSAGDAAVAAEIAALCGEPVVDLAGRTSLAQAIELLSVADRGVTNDSGLMHVAAALERPMAAVFGSSSPAHTPPLSGKARVISLQLACSPCFKRECPLGHTNCLETLDPARVLSALE